MNLHEVDSHIFPAGEVSVTNKVCSGEYLKAHIRNSEDLVKLLLVADTLKHRGTLVLPYVPYGRQDRVCNEGEAHSLRVFCNLINNLSFEKVVIFDPHSDVTPALLNNCEVISSLDIIKRTLLDNSLKQKALVLVSPDFGATKKVEAIAKHYKHDTIIQGVKKRDLSTGSLSGFDAYGDVSGKDLLIVDDICDGGGTFVGLASVLKDRGCASITLYVTHNVFSKGYNLQNIDNIVTVKTYNTDPLGTARGDVIRYSIGKFLKEN